MGKIGVNGFAGVGRAFVRLAIQKSKSGCTITLPKVVQINDGHINAVCIKTLLKHDSLYGRFKYEIIDAGPCMMVEGLRIMISQEKTTQKIPWKNECVDYVIDTVGANGVCEQAQKHFCQGVKRVIVIGTSCTVPVFVIGVNHDCFNLEDKVVSPGSPDLNCFGPLLKVLLDNFCISHILINSFYPYRSADRYIEGHTPKDCRFLRSHKNYAPTRSANPTEIVNKIFPDLSGKIALTGVRLPALGTGAIQMTAIFENNVTLQDVNCKILQASETYMKNIIKYSDDEMVSGDIIGRPYSCVYDGKAGINLGKRIVKLFAWHDVNLGYASSIYDLLSYIRSRECKEPNIC